MTLIIYLSYFFIGGVISSLNLLYYLREARMYRIPLARYNFALVLCLLIGITIAWPSLVIDTVIKELSE